MDSQYDMTTLDAEHRMDIFVVIGELDPSTITIHDDSNIGEIRDTISKKLKVPIEDQGSLVCINNNGEVCNVELTKEDAENGKKMTEYDPPIVKGAVFNLEVSDAFDLKIIERHQSIPREQAPKAPSMDDSEAHMRPTSIQGEKQRQKRAKKQARSFHQQQDREQQKHKQQRQQMRQQQAQQAQQQQQRRPQGQQVQQGLNIQSHRGYHPNQQQLALYAKIQKHSKTHCRLLFVLMVWYFELCFSVLLLPLFFLFFLVFCFLLFFFFCFFCLVIVGSTVFFFVLFFDSGNSINFIDCKMGWIGYDIIFNCNIFCFMWFSWMS